MAQVLHTKDGQPVDDINALPVKIAGADASSGAVNVNIADSGVTVQVDHQATLVSTAVTHTGAACVNGATNYQATWQQLPEGVSEFVLNLITDVGNSAIATVVQWSEDGTNVSGKSGTTLPSTADIQKTSLQWYPIAGSFYKVGIYNGHTAPVTCSANIKFRP